MEILGSIWNVLKSIVLWVFLLGFGIGSYITMQAMSYLDYNVMVLELKTNGTKKLLSDEYLYSFRNNIFYKFDRWGNPDKFKNIRKFEIQAIRDEAIQTEKDLIQRDVDVKEMKKRKREEEKQAKINAKKEAEYQKIKKIYGKGLMSPDDFDSNGRLKQSVQDKIKKDMN